MSGVDVFPLGPADQVPDGQVRRFDVGGRAVAVVRIGDDYYALGDTCSHADYSLSEGYLWAGEGKLECPRHGSRFSLETGEPDSLPATRPVPTYEVDRRDGELFLVIGRADTALSADPSDTTDTAERADTADTADPTDTAGTTETDTATEGHRR